ncbi:MAG TPA: protein YgfX [Solimonas sp.]
MKPSLRALRVVFLLHVICLVLLMFAMQPGWPMMVLVALFGVSWFALRHSAVLGLNAKAITRVVWHADGGWLVFRGVHECKAELKDNSLIHPALTVLNFRLHDGGRATRVIAGGEAEAEQLRRLRARLSLKS